MDHVGGTGKSEQAEDTMVIYLDLFPPWVLCFGAFAYGLGGFSPLLTWDSHFRRKLAGLFLEEETKLWAEVANSVAWRRDASDEGGSQRADGYINKQRYFIREKGMSGTGLESRGMRASISAHVYT